MRVFASLLAGGGWYSPGTVGGMMGRGGGEWVTLIGVFLIVFGLVDV